MKRFYALMAVMSFAALSSSFAQVCDPAAAPTPIVPAVAPVAMTPAEPGGGSCGGGGGSTCAGSMSSFSVCTGGSSVGMQGSTLSEAACLTYCEGLSGVTCCYLDTSSDTCMAYGSGAYEDANGGPPEKAAACS